MEGEAAHRALALAQLAGCRLLLFHLTTIDSLAELRRARDAGRPPSARRCCTTCCWATSSTSIPSWRRSSWARRRCGSREHRDALWRALADGTLDVVSTDHGPRRRIADESGRLRHQSGTSGVEVRLALMHDRGVLDGRIDLQRWVEVCCTAPARLHGLPPEGPAGARARRRHRAVRPRRRAAAARPPILHSDIDHSTYDGQDVRGWPVVTISRGEVIVDRGEWLGEPGRGRFLRRSIG